MIQSRPEPEPLDSTALRLPRRRGRALAAGDQHKQQRGVRRSRWHARVRGTKAQCAFGLNTEGHDTEHMSPQAGRGGASCRPPVVCTFSWDSIVHCGSIAHFLPAQWSNVGASALRLAGCGFDPGLGRTATAHRSLGE